MLRTSMVRCTNRLRWSTPWCRPLLNVILATALGAGGSPAAAEPTDEPIPLLDGLGTHHLPISTGVPATQVYFDQGFRLFYAFNFAESVRSFREAARRDPACAMCYWGIALALGPNINAPMNPRRGMEAYEAIQRATELSTQTTARERAYIEALAARYSVDPFADRAPLDAAYAAATGGVVERYPDDADATVLHAAAVMNLNPWDYWTPDRVPKPGIAPIVDRLAAVVDSHPQHAGACHFYIHLVESAWPERAVPCADRLPALMPGAGHVVHMPAHVYIRVGRYEDAVDRNRHAVHADETYIAEHHPVGEYPSAYYPHNYHFLAFAASMAGDAETALEAARRVVEQTDASLLTDPDLGGTLQHFITTPLSMHVRFSQWDEVMATPAFDSALTYPNGHRRFARGMALVARGRPDEAASELDALRGLIAHPDTAVAIFGLNRGDQVLAIAEAVLAGTLAAGRGALAEAVTHLSRGIELEDRLIYNEPPDWSLSVRQVLAGVWEDAGRLDEAARVYRDDLRTYPGNRWSTDALAELERRRRERRER